MPRRTLSPRISITVTVMLSLMMMLSFFLRERTSIAAPLWCSSRSARTIHCCEQNMGPGKDGMQPSPFSLALRTPPLVNCTC